MTEAIRFLLSSSFADTLTSRIGDLREGLLYVLLCVRVAVCLQSAVKAGYLP